MKDMRSSRVTPGARRLETSANWLRCRIQQQKSDETRFSGSTRQASSRILEKNLVHNKSGVVDRLRGGCRDAGCPWQRFVWVTSRPNLFLSATPIISSPAHDQHNHPKVSGATIPLLPIHPLLHSYDHNLTTSPVALVHLDRYQHQNSCTCLGCTRTHSARNGAPSRALARRGRSLAHGYPRPLGSKDNCQACQRCLRAARLSRC